jgi:hypothetical protein
LSKRYSTPSTYAIGVMVSLPSLSPWGVGAFFSDIWVSDLLKQLKLQAQRELDLPRSAGAMPSKTKLLSSSPRPAKPMLRWLLPPVSTALGTNAVSVDQFLPLSGRSFTCFDSARPERSSSGPVREGASKFDLRSAASPSAVFATVLAPLVALRIR